MKKRFLSIMLLLSSLLSACSPTSYDSINPDSGYTVYNAYSDEESEKESNNEINEEDNSDENVTKEEIKQSELSSIYFENLTNKQKKKLKQDLRKIFAEYFGVDASDISLSSLTAKLKQVSDYGFIIKDENSVYLNELAITDLIDLFTEGLKIKKKEQEK